jgi:aminopeptidase N
VSNLTDFPRTFATMRQSPREFHPIPPLPFRKQRLDQRCFRLLLSCLLLIQLGCGESGREEAEPDGESPRLTQGIEADLLDEDTIWTQLDVLAYQVELAPDLAEQSIRGKVSLSCRLPKARDTLRLDSGDLTVTQSAGKYVRGFEQDGQETLVLLQSNRPDTVEIALWYHGTPRQGLVFPAEQQLYSVYFTSHWMVCNASPDDKATFALDLILPAGLNCVASGSLQHTTEVEDNIRYTWRQDYETPAYTFGFAVGKWQQVETIHDGTTLALYSDRHSPDELQKIFQITGDVLTFLEAKAGIPYPQDRYAQVLMGNHFQEMSGFAMLRSSYGDLLLRDSTETHLISHELAHQWWGNRITCQSWNHFWLNEGVATFLSAAYNEHRFGAAQYAKDIANYRKTYEDIRSRGGDQSLVFADWSNPSRDDRNLVYFKGAYVLHLLREEMGEATFWEGFRQYSQTYHGRSVTTVDFQQAMEAAAERSLAPFFEEWVYEGREVSIGRRK